MDSFSVRNDFKYSTFSEIFTFYSPFISKYSIDLIVLKREGLLIIISVSMFGLSLYCYNCDELLTKMRKRLVIIVFIQNKMLHCLLSYLHMIKRKYLFGLFRSPD